MKLATAVRDYLRTVSGVTSIAGKRVYKRRAPVAAQVKAGSFVIVSIASANFFTQSTAAEEGSYKVKVRLQLDSYSSDEDEVDRLSEAVAKGMRLKKTTIQSIEIKSCRQDDERDNYEPLRDGSDDGVHRITQDYTVEYVETV